ncbi:putative type VI secretion system effector [Photorhabdus akhurstii]|uniref:putative type VI secretion system effector n=1 Tax=Photorhabdus akhurstii TaxID=171438 RepID=UPI0037037C76
MSTFRPYKEAIDFDEIKRQRKDIGISVKIKREIIIPRYPEDREEIEKAIEERQAKIPELDAILAKEPPPPELPPRKPLIKVSGVLEEFETLCVIGYFTDREYDPVAFARKEEQNQFGALLLSMAGNSAGAAITSQTEDRRSDVCDFVRGKINGVPFYGWLGFTVAKVGDYVELAVTELEGHYVVYAIAHPELRVISMTPRCKQGIHSNAKYQVRGNWYCFLFFMFFYMMIDVFFVKMDIIEYMKYVCFFCVLAAAILSPFIYFSCMRNPKPTFRLAEEIFTALGFPNPTEVNLYRFTKKKLKEIKANPPNEESSKGSVWPDRHCLLSYFYYY